jgi:hypothetical protein
MALGFAIVRHLFGSVLEALDGADLAADAWLTAHDRVYWRELDKSQYGLLLRSEPEDRVLVLADLRDGVHLWTPRQDWDAADLGRRIGAQALRGSPPWPDLPSGLALNRTCDFEGLRDALVLDIKSILEEVETDGRGN